MPRILLADDNAITRRGLKEILTDAFPLAEIEAVPDAEELMLKVYKSPFDLVISDISMPGRSGLEVLGELRTAFPKMPVIILSVHPEIEYAVRVIKSGGAAFLNKDDAVEDELVKAVQVVLAGKRYITPAQAELLANQLAQGNEKLPHETLSDREFDVFKLLAQGKTTGDIAAKLSLSPNTIGTFRARLLSKMNLKSNSEIVAYAIKNKLV